MKGTLLMLASGLLVAAGATVLTAQATPQDAKPLSEIIKAVEGKQAGVIFEIELDDGMWEVEVYKNNQETKFYLDPKTGQEKRQTKSNDRPDELPPQNGKALSEIIKSIENETSGMVTDVEFDDGYWEVTIRKDGRKMKMDLDPRSGQSVISTRPRSQ